MKTIRPDNVNSDYLLVQSLTQSQKYDINWDENTFVAIFKTPQDSYWVCTINDLVEAGTPIDPETGDDLEYVGQGIRVTDIEV